MVCVHRGEDLLRLLAGDVELVLQDLLQLLQGHRAVMVLVHGQEVVAHLRAVLVGEGPCHHLHAAPPELGRLAELPERGDHALVNHGLVLVPRVDPRVLQRLLGGEPLHRVDLQQALHEVQRRLRDGVPPLGLQLVGALRDVLRLRRLVAREGHVPRQDDEGDHPEAPEVALARVVLLQDLRRNVGEGPAADVHLHVGVPDLAEAEVDQLQVAGARLVVQKVLQLEVPMHDAVGVDVVERQQHLVDSICRVALAKPLELGDAVEQLTTLHAFHHEVQLVLRIEHIVEARDVRVIHA
mmetsp:Transcript_6695/g.19691  ORF Transcript_6695/g.19691 Transcript_6695/m.19691 type:complete len:296 (-) Transcript_6695:302-1189(-)